MVPGAWCGAIGVGGWMLMATFWLAFLALAVWAISRIFPRTPSAPPEPRAQGEARAVTAALTGSSWPSTED